MILTHSAFHEGDQLPAKVIPSKNFCSISYDGKGIVKHHFEYLTGSGFEWVPVSNGSVPSGTPVSSGNTVKGEPVFIGRAHHQGSLTPGKVLKGHDCLHFAYGGVEHWIKSYEMLVMN
jgi:hypothetical protein